MASRGTLPAMDQGTTAVLADFLTSNNFEVVYFELTDADVTLEPEDLLLILSPQRDFMPTELEAITDFAAAGGNLFITCDYTDDVSAMPNYQSLLRSYGFQPLDGVVIAGAEETGTYYDGLQIALLPYMQSSAATMDLVENNQDTLLLTGARAFAQPEEGDQNLITQVVLSSGYQAYLRSRTAIPWGPLPWRFCPSGLPRRAMCPRPLCWGAPRCSPPARCM